MSWRHITGQGVVSCYAGRWCTMLLCTVEVVHNRWSGAQTQTDTHTDGRDLDHYLFHSRRRYYKDIIWNGLCTRPGTKLSTSPCNRDQCCSSPLSMNPDKFFSETIAHWLTPQLTVGNKLLNSTQNNYNFIFPVSRLSLLTWSNGDTRNLGWTVPCKSSYLTVCRITSRHSGEIMMQRWFLRRLIWIECCAAWF